MKRIAKWIPGATVLVVAAAMCVHGPIAQFANYHDFADGRSWLGIPNACDVLSGVGFAFIGLWGLHALRGRPHPYRLFLWALALTAFGSGFYHLAPDNSRLVWDRLPIALACAGILAAVYAQTHPSVNSARLTLALAIFGVGSVLWWSITERVGAGDLRPYVLLQGAPLLLVPMWQAIHGSPRRDRIAFGAAILLYVAAKVAEVYDAAILDALQIVGGHTLKHLLATAAGAVIVVNAVSNVRMKREASCSA